jgi:hypothetical protein
MMNGDDSAIEHFRAAYGRNKKPGVALSLAHAHNRRLASAPGRMATRFLRFAGRVKPTEVE